MFILYPIIYSDTSVYNIYCHKSSGTLLNHFMKLNC